MEARSFHGLRHGILGFRRLGAGARRILEGIGGRETNFPHEAHRVLEIRIGFAGKPTMKSEVIAISGLTLRTRSMIAR